MMVDVAARRTRMGSTVVAEEAQSLIRRDDDGLALTTF